MGHSDLSLLLGLVARLGGFFLFSPFFSQKGLSIPLRFGLTLVLAFLFLPPFSRNFKIPELSWFLLPSLISEAAIGYFIGLLMSLIIEVGMFAGQVIGTFFGLSATELVDPLASSPQPLMGRFFALLFFIFLLCFDCHHLIIRLLYTNFASAPPFNPIGQDAITTLMKGMHLFFSNALNFILIPFAVFLPLVLLFGVATRLFPNVGLVWLLFPVQVIFGLTVAISFLPLFAPLLQQACYEFFSLLATHLFPL